jgi:hypothetical protein
MTGLLVFFVLQALDMATTLYFRVLGVEESNPIINGLTRHAGTGYAVLLVKVFAVLFAVMWYRRRKSFTVVNVAFGVLIVWNLIAIHAWQHGVRYCGASCWGNLIAYSTPQQFQPIRPTPIRPTPIGKSDWNVKRTPVTKTTPTPEPTPISTTEDKPEPETPTVIKAHPVKPEPITDGKPRINNQ